MVVHFHFGTQLWVLENTEFDLHSLKSSRVCVCVCVSIECFTMLWLEEPHNFNGCGGEDDNIVFSTLRSLGEEEDVVFFNIYLLLTTSLASRWLVVEMMRFGVCFCSRRFPRTQITPSICIFFKPPQSHKTLSEFFFCSGGGGGEVWMDEKNTKSVPILYLGTGLGTLCAIVWFF